MRAIAGAIIGTFLWWGIKQRFNISSYFYYEWGDLFDFGFTENNRLFLRLFWTDYRVLLVFYLVTASLASIRRNQRYLLPVFFASLALVGSILFLYSGMWKGVEHESGGRYFSQSMLAWVMIYFVCEGRFVLAAYRYCYSNVKKKGMCLFRNSVEVK